MTKASSSPHSSTADAASGGRRLGRGGAAAVAPVPEFHNLGVWLRAILLVNAGAALIALVDAERLSAWGARYLDYAWRLEPLLLLSLTLLSLSGERLRRLPFWLAQLVVSGGVALLAVLMEGLWRRLWLSEVIDMAGVLRLALLAAIATWVLLYYFLLRHQAVRPAVDAAQVAALTARIRPHFLFNSLNAVLSLIRREPQRAEQALESLADLFRVLMRDPRDLVPLSEEIALCRQYLELERLRLGDRLQVEWAVADVPGEMLVPPLMLQPLLENAVYHGIEPADCGGRLRIGFARETGGVRIEILNSLPSDRAASERHSAGNHMALTNIRQRLALYYDLEASLEAGPRGDEYCVALLIPFGRRAA